MEKRLEKYKKIRKRKVTKLTISALLIFYLLIISFNSNFSESTYAWFSVEANSNGEIKNAVTSDLITINTGEVDYLKNCKVKSIITLTNISTINIPITLELQSKNNGNHIKSLVLSPGNSYISNPNDTDNLPHNCDATEITYHLYGFEGFIDEYISIPLNREKLLATIQEPKKGQDNNQNKQLNNEEKPVQNDSTLTKDKNIEEQDQEQKPPVTEPLPIKEETEQTQTEQIVIQPKEDNNTPHLDVPDESSTPEENQDDNV
ncbi:hypothetical protein IHV12_04935 [Fictibacillus sp. 7GRE50]|uniref:hypothetical protein n=1 Tax=Fictibacillus sp. 7GRE50 TaxID=2745878 RepID=UPI0018CF1EAD|nr:hypothetical protein [Fictibacillus sp. 7GRE50]MBH0164248.1 hypothetical protein [Fictibacillus sp. 7GRE50]